MTLLVHGGAVSLELSTAVQVVAAAAQGHSHCPDLFAVATTG